VLAAGLVVVETAQAVGPPPLSVPPVLPQNEKDNPLPA
jgi:hypothetical protein